MDEITATPKKLSFGFERVRGAGDTLVVTQVYPVSPANKAGLKKWDRLLGGPELAADSSMPATVALTVLRDGVRLTLPSMTKTEVRRPTVYLDSLGGLYPLIEVTEFTTVTNHPQGTAAEFRAVLQEIRGAPVAVLDLRGNGGGSVAHCTQMAFDLLPAGDTLVIDRSHTYNAKRKGPVVDTIAWISGPGDGLGSATQWIVLVDEGSASCSERLLAAL
jgi:C-terminal processing protease CtpA/Prc